MCRLLWVGLVLAGGARAELVLIAHPALAAESLPRSVVSRIFLGQSERLPDGSPAQVLHEKQNQSRFYAEVLGRDPAQVEKYWARAIFSGRVKPPREVPATALKSVVASTPGALAYIDKAEVDASVRVIRIEADR
ncbi:MAG: hypothetical protein ACK4UT_06035 [Moraxellaceae bacterium]